MIHSMLALLFALPDPLPAIDPNAPVDPLALVNDAISIWHNWKTAGPVAALTMLVYVLTQISKNTWLLSRIPSYWRPYFALGLGVTIGSLSAVVSGTHFWPGAVLAGAAAGFGSVAFDQLLTQWKAGTIARLQKATHNGTGSGTGPGAGTAAAVALFLALGSFGAKADEPLPPPPVVQALPLVAPSDPPPVPPVTSSSFGGCPTSKVCFGPWVSVNLMAANLTSGKIEASFSPGVGYGVTGWPGQWYSLGFALTGDANPSSQQAQVGGIFSFANGYLHIGLSKSFIGDHSWRIPLGFTLPLP
jgi:hypothetical protein